MVKRKKKNDKSWLFALLIIGILLIVAFFFVFNGSLLGFLTGSYYDEFRGEGAYDGSGTDGGDDGSSDSSGGPTPDSNDGDIVRRTFTGGGIIKPDTPCTIYVVNDDYEDPYLFFTYTANWDEQECEGTVLIWKIYDDGRLIKTIIQTEPGSGQTYIYTYRGGDIKICFELESYCPSVSVSWVLKIFD